MNTFTKSPIIVSVIGPAKIGVTATCTRVKYALENIGYTAAIVAPRTLQQVYKFERDYKDNVFGDCDVILIDNHHYTLSSICTARKDISFNDSGAVKPTISVLLIAASTDYVAMLKQPICYKNEQKAREIMNKYQNCDRKVFGCLRLSILAVRGEHGRLECAGRIKNMIVKELKRAK